MKLPAPVRPALGLHLGPASYETFRPGDPLQRAQSIPKLEAKRNEMSAVVDVTSQVVMHPVVSHSLKVWGTTLGRDKVGPAIPLTT